MSSQAIKRIVDNLTALREPPISLQSHLKVGNGVYTVAFTTDRGDYQGEKLAEAFSKIFTGAFTVARNTMMKVYNPHHNLYTAVVLANTENHSLNDETLKSLGLTLITANVFTDEQNNVWKAVGEGDNKRIVLTSTDDYDKILNTRRSKQVITASLNTALLVAMGDFVTYYDAVNKRVDSGFAVSASVIYSQAQLAEVSVLSELIIEVAAADSLDIDPLAVNVAEVTAAKGGGKARFLEYWAKLYKDRNPFFADLRKLMEKSTEF